jgi:hypothetical protein
LTPSDNAHQSEVIIERLSVKDSKQLIPVITIGALWPHNMKVGVDLEAVLRFDGTCGRCTQATRERLREQRVGSPVQVLLNRDMKIEIRRSVFE